MFALLLGVGRRARAARAVLGAVGGRRMRRSGTQGAIASDSRGRGAGFKAAGGVQRPRECDGDPHRAQTRLEPSRSLAWNPLRAPTACPEPRGRGVGPVNTVLCGARGAARSAGGARKLGAAARRRWRARRALGHCVHTAWNAPTHAASRHSACHMGSACMCSVHVASARVRAPAPRPAGEPVAAHSRGGGARAQRWRQRAARGGGMHASSERLRRAAAGGRSVRRRRPQRSALASPRRRCMWLYCAARRACARSGRQGVALPQAGAALPGRPGPRVAARVLDGAGSRRVSACAGGGGGGARLRMHPRPPRATAGHRQAVSDKVSCLAGIPRASRAAIGGRRAEILARKQSAFRAPNPRVGRPGRRRDMLVVMWPTRSRAWGAVAPARGGGVPLERARGRRVLPAATNASGGSPQRPRAPPCARRARPGMLHLTPWQRWAASADAVRPAWAGASAPPPARPRNPADAPPAACAPAARACRRPKGPAQGVGSTLNHPLDAAPLTPGRHIAQPASSPPTPPRCARSRGPGPPPLRVCGQSASRHRIGGRVAGRGPLPTPVRHARHTPRAPPAPPPGVGPGSGGLGCGPRLNSPAGGRPERPAGRRAAAAAACVAVCQSRCPLPRNH